MATKKASAITPTHKTITQEEFLRDPARYVKESQKRPIAIIGKDKKLQGVMSFPVVDEK
jgi:hypothetical protein